METAEFFFLYLALKCFVMPPYSSFVVYVAGLPPHPEFFSTLIEHLDSMENQIESLSIGSILWSAAVYLCCGMEMSGSTIARLYNLALSDGYFRRFATLF